MWSDACLNVVFMSQIVCCLLILCTAYLSDSYKVLFMLLCSTKHYGLVKKCEHVILAIVMTLRCILYHACISMCYGIAMIKFLQ